jgi:ABC-type transporter Mla subunit MlaD
MRRALIILVGLIATAAILATGVGAGGDDGNYEVRAIFDNAAFLVPGEQVRIAGATVGEVAAIDLTTDDEVVHEDGSPDPGKAVVVMKITEPGFQDFRTDASCLIRPQSLIGEKFVECQPTEPRAAGVAAPPELDTIPDGQPGAGERLLPLDRNGTAVDLDLVNDIMREPYPDRFRLILNSLGAGFAARGEELAEIIQRSNPALRETNEVLGTLASQNEVLAKLSSDSDAVISALARKRENIADFINSSNVVGAATAERSADLEKSFQEFPHFLVELRSTMDSLDAFSQAATPVFTDLGNAAPALTRATKALSPFADAGTTALTSLGDTADIAGPDLVNSDPVIRQVRGLAKSGAPGAKNLAKLLASLRKTNGFDYLKDFIFNSGGALNPFDSRGHFLRAYLPLNSCVDYEIVVESNCGGFFDLTKSDDASSKSTSAMQTLLDRLKRIATKGEGSDETSSQNTDRGGTEHGGSTAPDNGGADQSQSGQDEPEIQVDPSLQTPEPDQTTTTPDEPQIEVTPGADSTTPQEQAAPGARMRAARQLMEFLIGDQRSHRGGGG